MINDLSVSSMRPRWDKLDDHEILKMSRQRNQRAGGLEFHNPWEKKTFLGRFYDMSQEVYRFILLWNIYSTDTGVSRMVTTTYSTRFVQPTDFPQDAVGEIPLPQGSNSYGWSVCTGYLYTGVVPLLMAPLARSKILIMVNNASPVSLLAVRCEYISIQKIFE